MTDNPTREELAEQVAKIQPGDTVTAEFTHYGDILTVSGPARISPSAASQLMLGPFVLSFDGGPIGGSLVRIVSHTPAPIPEPEWQPGDVIFVRVSGSRTTMICVGTDDWISESRQYYITADVSRYWREGCVTHVLRDGKPVTA